MTKNFKGEDITDILNLFNEAANLRDGSIESEREYNRWSDIFHIAMYQGENKAWAYYDQTEKNRENRVN